MLPMVGLVLQRGVADCGIAALAMYLGLSYEDVFAAVVTKAKPKPHQGGMTCRQVQSAACRFGVRLLLRRSWDLETSCGLLTVDKIEPKPDEFSQHLVLLRFGLIFDTDATVWEPETYFAQHRFKPVSLLAEAHDGTAVHDQVAI